MKITLVFLTVTAALFAQESAPPQPTPTPHRMTRAEAYAKLSAESKEQLIGERLDQIFPPSLLGKTLPAAVRSQSGKSTIAVFMGSRCIHCKNQAPYLKTLDSDARTAGAIDVVPVFFEADTGRDAFLASFGWQAKAAVVKSADLAAFPIRGTPTLVVADPAGKVTGEYIGELTPAQQAELSTLVKK